MTYASFRICSQNAFAAYPFSCLTAFQLTNPFVKQYNAISLWERFFLFVNHPAASGGISEAYRGVSMLWFSSKIMTPGNTLHAFSPHVSMVFQK